MSKMKLAPLASAIRASRWPYALGTLLAPGLVFAGPTGGNVVAGQATISAPNGTTTVVNQSSQGSVIHWQGFDVGSDEYVIFNQPSASAAVLNKVVGGSPSEILGHLQSNGRVFIINPQGVLFGQGAQVNVGSLVASTMNIADSDFMAGRYVMSGAGSGSVVNQGSIKAAQGGFVVLSGNSVSNSGVIAAKLGDVALASGNAVTLDLDGNGLVSFRVDEASLSAQAGVNNLGEIVAQGGNVVMTARTARNLAQSAVNNSGTVSARGIAEDGGDIYLVAEGGNISNSGTLDASGSNGHDAGGVLIHSDADITLGATSTIDITGKNGGVARVIAEKRLVTAEGSLIDGRAGNQNAGKGGFTELSGHGGLTMSGETLLGKGGTLLLDPNSICISASYGSCGGSFDSSILESSIESSLNYGTNVAIIAADNIFVGSDLTGGAINSDSDSSAELLLGIGYAGSGSTGGFGYAGSGLLSLPGGFTNTNALNSNGGKITFQGATPGGVNIGGNLVVRGGLDRGAITIGNVTARHVDVRGHDLITLGNVVSTLSDVVIQSDTAIRAGNISSAQGGIYLRFANSGTSSSVGNLTANNAPSNGICINSNSCDFEYDDSFSGYGAGQATLDVGSGTHSWSASHVLIDNTLITGGTLAISSAAGYGTSGFIDLLNSSAIDVASLSLTSPGDIEIYGAQIDADTLTIQGNFLHIDEGASLSGVNGTIKQTANAEYGGDGIYNSSLNFSTKLEIDAVGQFDIQDTYFNEGFDDDNNGDSPVNPLNLPLTHEVVIKADDLDLVGFTTLNAGKLTIEAEAGDVFISGGMNLNFKTGTISATADPNASLPQALVGTDNPPAGLTETPMPVQSGRVYIGEYRPDQDDGEGGPVIPDTSTDAATLRFGTLIITSGETTAEHATLGDSDIASTLTVNGMFKGHSSAFYGANATFADTDAAVLGDSQFHYTYIDSSTFGISGQLSISSNHDVILNANSFNPAPGQTPTPPSAGSSIKITGGNLIASNNVFRASTIELNAKSDGYIHLSGGSLAYNTAKLGVLDAGNQTTTGQLDVQDVMMTGFGAGSSISFAAQDLLSVHGSGSHISVNDLVHDTNGSASFRVTSATGYGDLSETTVNLTGDLKINSAHDFIIDADGFAVDARSLQATTAGYFEMYNVPLTAESVTVTANGNSNGLSASFINSEITLSGGFTVTGKHGVEFVGFGGEGDVRNELVASTITANSEDGFLRFSNSVMATDAGVFKAGGTDEEGYSIDASASGFTTSANGTLDFNGASDVYFGNGSIVSARMVTFHAGGSLTLDGDFSASNTLTATAGFGTDLDKAEDAEDGVLYLAGAIEAGHALLSGAGGVYAYDALTVNAAAIDVAGKYIHMENADFTVGAGAANQGIDPLLVNSIAVEDPEITLPHSARPNIAFKAEQEIWLGDVDFEAGGDYMFAQGSNLRFHGLIFDDQLFLNFTPSDPSADFAVSGLEHNFNDAQSGLTLAFGSSRYLGNITVENPIDTEGSTANFVFATNGGTITGAENVHSNGRVLVLTEFSGGATEDAAAVINQVNNLLIPKGTASQEGVEGQGDGADAGDAANNAANPEGPIEFQGGGGEEGDNEFECT